MNNVIELPYGGDTHPNSGHAGSDTSQARAIREDADGTTGARQRAVLRRLAHFQETGLTWREWAAQSGDHHGQASGVLSGLHKAGRIARLTETRRRCKVYVLPEYVNGRPTEAQGKTSTHVLLDQAIDVLRHFAECPDHRGLRDFECNRCEAAEVVRHYENRK